MNLITIKTFDNPIDAHLLRTRIESEGVNCFLFDENIVGLNPLYNVMVGGIKLKIKEDDVDRVKAILIEIENSPITDDKNIAITCPNCESKEIIPGFKSMKGTKGLFSAIISFLFMVFPIYYATVYRCKNCGAEFK